MARKVSRADSSGALTAFDPATLAQVKSGRVVVELEDGSDAVLGTVEQIISGLVDNAVAEILRQKTLDLRYQGAETWVLAPEGQINSARGALGNTELEALTGWAPAYTIPSGTETTGEIIVRLLEGDNPNDYRISNGFYTVNVGDLAPVGFATSTTYDYYLFTVQFEDTFAVGQRLVLDHHGTPPHTSYYGSVPEIETAITDINANLSGKQDILAVDMDIDNHFYVRANVRPVEYALELKNIVPALLPSVNNIHVIIKGSPVHSVSFDTSIADQVIAVELSGTELQNINNNVRPDEDFIIFEVRLREDSTVVYSELIPIAVVDAPPVSPSREILTWDTSRASTVTATLPTTYTGWQFCKLLVLQGGNTDTILIQTSDLARGNLTNFGRGNSKFSWVSSTRVLTTQQGRTSASFISVSLI